MKLRNRKTGEIIDDGYVRETYDFQFDGQKHVLAVFKGNGHSVPERISGPYNSLAELNEEWEDYKPAEPLIKDKKVRKAVRAWAEANEITNIFCYQYKRTCEFDCERTDLDCYASIRFIGDDIIDKRHNNATYSITELCGEEEE